MKIELDNIEELVVRKLLKESIKDGRQAEICRGIWQKMTNEDAQSERLTNGHA